MPSILKVITVGLGLYLCKKSINYSPPKNPPLDPQAKELYSTPKSDSLFPISPPICLPPITPMLSKALKYGNSLTLNDFLPSLNTVLKEIPGVDPNALQSIEQLNHNIAHKIPIKDSIDRNIPFLVDAGTPRHSVLLEVDPRQKIISIINSGDGLHFDYFHQNTSL